MRSIIVFILLMSVRGFSRLFYRFRLEWIGEAPRAPFRDLRMVCILNHTSLFEPLLAGFAPLSLIWDFARHGVLPVAEKTMKRTVGLLFRFMVRHVVVVTRQRDQTWERLLNKVDDQALVTILPEGRMKRRNGLDSTGRPMTIRGGIVDILSAIPNGRILMLYSGGLHHIQAPGERLPRLFKTIQARMEIIEISEYRDRLLAEYGEDEFKAAVIRDLTARRDTHCPADPDQRPADHDIGSPGPSVAAEPGPTQPSKTG